MRLLYLELSGFKSFAKKTKLVFESSITAVVGPNGSGKSNVAEAFRWVLGEQSLKSLRGKRGEDLIFNGGGNAGRMNRASVSIAFDNSRREFNIDYDEVVITRTVHRDGSNEYEINGSQVRLKDIIELLSNVSLGSTGHHIISQGEADRILNSNLRERREMIEEALGLKIYHWKIAESEKKLARTEENIKQVESLRREIAPHLKFLKKQVEKIEKADAMRRELKQLYLHYFKKEERYLIDTKEELRSELAVPQQQLDDVIHRLDELAQTLQSDQGDSALQDSLSALEKRSREIQRTKDDLSRSIGRIEGIIEVKAESQTEDRGTEVKIDLQDVEALIHEINTRAEEVRDISDVSILRQAVVDIKNLVAGLVARYRTQTSEENGRERALATARDERDRLVAQMQKLDSEEMDIRNRVNQVKAQIEAEKNKTMGAERELYELKARKSELLSQVDHVKSQLAKVEYEENAFKRELAEAAVLVDQEVARYHNFVIQDENEDEPRGAQEERRRQIERLKIRLEDMGVEGTDVLEEYKETTKRDEHLARELEDLHLGAEGLTRVMTELRERLSVEFNSGIAKINAEFDKYFSLMFGGGTAALRLVQNKPKKRLASALLSDEEVMMEGEESAEEGIDIYVNLPRKKIKGLVMLSGGERALTSIALLFAMSQVNPPPFLILDETDAALDEANSRKYGDMIVNLSQHSQLILITHNRETMSRAGILYGVTMGNDGVSKLLSIKFDEAENYAK